MLGIKFREAKHKALSFLMLAVMILSVFVSIPQIAIGATAAKTFDFVEVTDFHGTLNPVGSTQPVAAVLAEQIKTIKAQNPDTVVLSGGDMFQGSALSNILKGQPVINMMTNIGFDAMALGNHEYDWGIDSVIDSQNAVIKGTSIPVLACNIYSKTTGHPVSYSKPDIMLEKDGVKIGLIGAVDNLEFPTSITPGLIKDVNFKDPAPIINQLAKDLRNQGAQIVVVVAHMGASQDKNGTVSGNLIDMVKQLSGVDAVFGGHTHTIVTTKVNNIPVGIGNAYGKGFLDLKVTLNSDGTVSAGNMIYNDDTVMYKADNPAVDSEVKAIVTKASKDVGPTFNEVVGTASLNLTREQSAMPFGDSLLGNWSSQAIKDTAQTDFAFMNNGGLRVDLPKGDITVSDVWALMPFDDTIYTMKMTGAQIKAVLEDAVQDGGLGIQIAGLSFAYDPSKPSMNRVISIKSSGGIPIELSKSYTVATNDFMADGGDKFIGFNDPSIVNKQDTGILVRDAFIKEMKTQKTMTASVDHRIQSTAVEVTVLATSDIHGSILPWDYSSAKEADLGLAKISTYVNQVRSQNPNVVLVDDGDSIQGTPLTYYYDKIDTKTEYPIAKVMGAMGYDTWTLGNHEYNYGLDVLNRVIGDMQKENINVLSANTYKDDNSNFVKPYYIKTISTNQGNVNVGIIGLTTKCIPDWEDKAHYSGLHFNDLVEEANKWVPIVRAAGADIVVVAAHSGEESPSDTIPENQIKAMATGVNGIDAIVAGHTHKKIDEDTFTNPDGQKVIVTEPRNAGKDVCQINFTITKDDHGKWQIADKSSKAITIDSKIAADPKILQIAKPYQDETLSYVATKIGAATGDFLGTNQLSQETPLMDLINKVQKHYAKTDLSIAAPLSNKAKILKGDVTIQDLMGVYVYENYLYGIKMTGKQLKNWMEWSARYYKQAASPSDPVTKDTALNVPDYNLDQLYGATYTIDLTQPIGSRIKNLKVNGKLVQDNDVFTVAINNYRYNGGGGFMDKAGISNPEVTFDSAKQYGDDGQVRNLMIKYIQEKGTIEPTIDNDWTISMNPVINGTGSAVPAPSTTDANKLQVTASWLNLRTGPGLDYSVVGSIPHGTLVELVSTSGDWDKISYQGNTYFINAKFVKPRSQVLKTVKVISQIGLNVRDGAALSGKILGALPYGSLVEVVGASGDWYKIIYKNGYGYIYAQFTAQLS
ncbi:5'-nucleotidase/2',3'-cyclic phosphodiesterase-like hydrolase [Desulfosporosinus acidiphilus SJ4]|uniref:5'-nucleotidase/2',3'-cyclic phosphodiesterase-like hydrolase n=1 Tax=Desulfosporosinus acidiphilus (strain DSM 22704 / JCM 16185 / SJ4) TaxID=646529 RepID=I4D7M5_DESAJ|nr:5'-nucleotidase C-terminal domain-containing protein [Desulfosporosinus acidiphilus]AFM41799.1 5'-nucleotidase/2',3'-cyclic phosphodiesterase-like hydrolase [Desulfosporosinus acidiphilus SJ4]